VNVFQPQPLITLRHVQKTYTTAAGSFAALRGIDLEVFRGEFVAIVGQSGSGKSTLLNLLTGIDRPTRGEIIVQSTPVHSLPERAMARWRGRSVGIVFQFFQLLPTLTAVENVMLPMDFCNQWEPRERLTRARVLLSRLGVLDQANKLPATLSGGQQQRVAIARALANDPELIVADEPTGNLDGRTAESIRELFKELADDGQTILAVTHDDSVRNAASRVVRIADGMILPSGDPAHV